jgi:phosphate:Na+ symporter
MSSNLAVISLVGAICLLLYGMNVAGEALQRVAGQKLRHVLATLGRNRLAALVAGTAITMLTQSSSATTLMLVGFARAGLVEMRQTIGLLLGADIGTTITVQLLAFRIYDYALLIVAIGAGLLLSSKRKMPRDLGQAILGFGLVFLALKIIIESMMPLGQNPLVRELFSSLGDAPLVALLLGAVFAALTTSSAATIGVVLALAAQGMIPLESAVPLVLGANVGTSLAALLSSIGGNPEAKRVAIAHVLFKLIGAAVFLPLSTQFANLIALTSSDPARLVANAHTAFNVALACVFLPLSNHFAEMVCWIVPDQENDEGFRPKYLDEYVLESPPLALGQATREVLRLADLVLEMVADTLKVFRDNDEELIEQLERREDQVDLLEESIKSYLTRLSQQTLTEEQSKREVGLLFVINDLEHIGDIVDKSMMQLARKKVEHSLTFSPSGMAEVEDLHRRVVENLQSVINAITTRDQELAQKVLLQKGTISRMERELRQAHISRLHSGARESIDTSSIHMDVLNDLKRINSHASNMAYVVLGELR